MTVKKLRNLDTQTLRHTYTQKKWKRKNEKKRETQRIKNKQKLKKLKK